jgi:hypothetical protein
MNNSFDHSKPRTTAPATAEHTSSPAMQSEGAKPQPKVNAATSRAATISLLNDALRGSFAGGQILLTPGILALDPVVQATILQGIRSFDRFNPDNDPYGEHDFGSFECGGETIFFNIDYYDLECLMGSDDPADPSVTTRVLTIMLAAEY